MQETNPLISFDLISINGFSQKIKTFHNCITALKEYENKSLEELRWEDYVLNKRSKLNGTKEVPYKTTLGADLKEVQGVIMCRDTCLTPITAMIEYENKSFEELRFEDYLIGNKQKTRQHSSNQKK